jgi:sugar diacid utilization regulator
VGVEGSVLAQSDTDDDGDPLLCSPRTDWGRLVAEAAASNYPRSPTRGALAMQVSDDGGSPVWVVPVQAGSETFAHLLFRGSGELHEADVRTLEISAQTAALLLLMHRQVAIVEQQLRGELIDDLLAERPPDWAAFHRRAKRAGMLDLDRPHSVLVMSADGVSRRQLLRAATEYAASRHGLAAEHATNIVLLLPDVAASEAARTVPADLGRALQARVTAGAAGPAANAAAVRTVHADADRCHRLLVALGRTGVGSTIEDLGALGLILEGTTRARVRRLLADTLGPLLAYDAEHNALLLETLHGYFMSGRNPPAAARLLQVHPNTVYQRLERIELVLGHRRWREPQGELEMQLALQFHRILQDIPLEDLLRA